MRLRIVSIGCNLFFSGLCCAQEPARFVNLMSCDEKVTIHDRTILSRKTVRNVKDGCAEGYPFRVVLVDTRFGFEAPTKTLHGINSALHIIEPSKDDVQAGYKWCPLGFRQDGKNPLGVLIEWGVRSHDVCDGRPSSTYRVYTPDNKVCLISGSQTTCVKVEDLHPEGQRRFWAVVHGAYSEDLASN